MYRLANTLTRIAVALPLLAVLIAFIWLSQRTDQPISGVDLYTLPNAEITYFEDVHCEMSMAQIHALQDDAFIPLPPGSAPNFGFNRSTIWLKFEVPNNVLASRAKFIEIKNPLLNEAVLYCSDGIHFQMIQEAGDNYYFSKRGNDARNYTYALSNNPNGWSTYFLKINSAGEQLITPLVLWTPEALAHRQAEDALIRGSYFGLICFILFFNLFIYFIIRERSSLYYVYYNLFLLMLQLSLGGYSFQYLWPGSPYVANVATPFFASLSVFALIRFSQHFLQVAEFYPNVNKYYAISGYLLLGNALLSLIPQPVCFHVSILLVNGIALMLNFAIIPTAIGVIRQNFKPAKIFLAAFLLLVITVFGFLATNFGIIQNAFFAEYGLLIGSAAEVILLSLAIVVRFKTFKDDALHNLRELASLQAEQNTILEQKVTERTEEIEMQKEEILSSIRYAERIQRNVLPSSNDIAIHFPMHYVIYQPKDIVSGDFYWTGLGSSETTGKKLKMFATADCTGHGVPGAMVSVLGCNLLRETVLQFPSEQPHQMLHRLEERLLSTITGTDHQHAGDGMDIGLLTYDESNKKLEFAGANINLFLYRNGEWKELKGTRRPIGLRQEASHSAFALHQEFVQKNDLIFCWTDGFSDMMGGAKGKKLKTSGVLELLKKVVTIDFQNQKKHMEHFIAEWQKGHDQIDDITITCLMIS
jgi:two-component system, sensor histidine kinase LadS